MAKIHPIRGCPKGVDRSKIGERTLTHGHTRGRRHTPEYKAWLHLIDRCENKNCKNYSDYGGRGIAVCKEWRESFAAFFAHIGPRPSGTQLDRIDNNRGYEPGNVRWTTRAVQCRNRRSNHFFTHDGKTMCLKDWAAHFGIKYLVVWKRINWGNWPFEKAMTTPVRQSTKTK